MTNGIIDSGQKIVTDGLVLHLDAAQLRSYPTTGTTWTDLSGNGRIATLINGPTFNSQFGGGIVMDGINDYGNVPVFNVTGSQITLESFFKLNSLQTTESGIIRKVLGYQLGFSNASTGTVRCLLNTDGTTGWTVSNDFYYPFLNNTWYHFGFAYNNGTTTIYVNGSNIRTIYTITGNIISNTNDIGIGAGNNAGSISRYINATIATTSIYNKALTAAEFSQNYNAIKSRYGL